MENLDVLEKLGKVAGIAGIAVGALVLIFGGIIQKNIFPGMTKEQGYSIIKMMIIAASFLAIIGIGAWVYTDYQKNKTEKKATLLTKNLLGTIVNEAGEGIPSVKIYVVQSRETEDKSDSDGKFILPLEGNGQEYFDVVFDHPQYQTVRKKVTVDFEDETKEITMDQVVMRTSFPPNPEGEVAQTPNNQPQNTGNTATSGATINLFYNDEGQGCQLSVNITIGGITYTPQTNPVQLTGLPPGVHPYSISGTAYCSSGGQCAVSGAGKLTIANGGQYYMVFDAANTCIATILGDSDYQALINALY